jgi:transposase
MLIHLDGIERQLQTFDVELGQIAALSGGPSGLTLTRFRGIAHADCARADRRDRRLRAVLTPRELASWLGITPSEYSSGDQQHRGHITLAATITPAGC